MTPDKKIYDIVDLLSSLLALWTLVTIVWVQFKIMDLILIL